VATEYRPTTGRVLAACFAGACAIALVVVLVTDGAGGLLAYAPWLLLPAAVVWAVFWNPRVVVDDSGLTLVNVLRTVRLPWPAIQDVDTRWALKLHTAYGTFGAWAAPSAGRYASRGISPNDIRHLPEERRSGGVRIGDSPHSPSGRAAEAIRAQWEQLRDAGHLDDPKLEFERPPVRWHVELIAIVAGLLAWGLAAQLLG
jgi:Bacterial PH domain